MKGDGILCGGGDGWVDFLERIGVDPAGESAFVARNFILDEGVLAERFESYKESGAMADHGTIEAWTMAHGLYLSERVFRLPVGLGPPALVDPSDVYSCPETFRFIDAASPFLSSDSKARLIRIEELSFVADIGEVVSRPTLKSWAEAVVLSRDSEATRNLDLVLETWSRKIDLRPVFAGFPRDMEDLFGDEPAGDQEDWADTLRDRLGLAHYDPGSLGTNIDVLVFVYPVSMVPTLTGTSRMTKPLVPPTVLDGRHSRAFLPAPRGSLTGHVIDLSSEARDLRREVLHPRLALTAEHLWRVGTIQRPVDLSALSTARALHIELIRQASGRPDYGVGTDGDLL